MTLTTAADAVVIDEDEPETVDDFLARARQGRL